MKRVWIGNSIFYDQFLFAVRHRASVLFELIQDDDQLKAERKKAKLEGREKYKGYSKDDMRLGGQTTFS